MSEARDKLSEIHRQTTVQAGPSLTSGYAELLAYNERLKRDIERIVTGAKKVQEAMRAENQQLKADAERYRQLRPLLSFDRGMHQTDKTDERRTVKSWWHLRSDSIFTTDDDDPPESLDAAIDAARGE